MGVGAIFFGDISGNNCRSYRGFAGLETEWQRDSVTGRSVVPPLVWRYLCASSEAARGNKYNGAVSGTIAVANNQIRALSAARPPHPRLSFDPLARAPANTPDCTPSVFKQTRTPLSPPLRSFLHLFATPVSLPFFRRFASDGHPFFPPFFKQSREIGERTRFAILHGLE